MEIELINEISVLNKKVSVTMSVRELAYLTMMLGKSTLPEDIQLVKHNPNLIHEAKEDLCVFIYNGKTQDMYEKMTELLEGVGVFE